MKLVISLVVTIPTVEQWVCGFWFLESSQGLCGFIPSIKCHIRGVKNPEHTQVLRGKTDMCLMFSDPVSQDTKFRPRMQMRN